MRNRAPHTQGHLPTLCPAVRRSKGRRAHFEQIRTHFYFEILAHSWEIIHMAPRVLCGHTQSPEWEGSGRARNVTRHHLGMGAMTLLTTLPGS